MTLHHLKNSEFVRQQAALLAANESNKKYAGLPPGTLRGTVVSVDDPEELGRVKVVFDDMNPDVPQALGSGQYSDRRVGSEPDSSHWIDVSPAFKGKQPKGLVGKRVNISPSSGQYQYAVLQDVLYDPQLMTKTAGKSMEMPNNSSMTRLPVYGAGELPPAGQENHGCMVIEEGGPMNSDWLCVCLRRQGSYFWVRHIDMSHGHSGQNDGKQNPDSSGDGQSPVNQQTVWDYVFPTTGGEMQKYSQYGTSPRANPYGGEAKWYEPPK
jgi:hypothetical protein